MNKSLFAVSLLCAGAAFAQAPAVLGKVANVEGVVTISDGVTVGTAVPGTVITQGNRFVTASSGAARLTMDNGCIINLKPNESLLIDSKLACRDLIASIQAVGNNAAVAAVGTGNAGGGMNTGLLAAGGALLAAGVAGGGGGGGGSTTPGGGAGGGTPVVPPISGQ